MMKNILVVRHGECKANVDNIVAGCELDSPLTARGIEQAKNAANKLKHMRIDRIVSSPMIRAKKTADIIAKIIEYTKPIDVIFEFTERCVGIMAEASRDDYFDMEKSHRIIPGAELETDMAARVEIGIDKLNQLSEENILLVTHNGTYRMMKCVIQGKDPNEFAFEQGLENSEIQKLELK